MNNVNLIGNLTRDPELRFSSNENAVCTFTIAVNRPKRADGIEAADFIRIVVFGKQATPCSNYLNRGSKVGITGRINTGSYTDTDGKKIYTTDVIADRVEFLTSKSGIAVGSNSADDRRENEIEAKSMEFLANFESLTDDDIPF